MFRILIVDDEEQTRSGIKKLLQATKPDIEEIQTAGDGEEALRLVHSFQPDILITDVVMPRMDGIELVKQARVINQSLKIIMISGFSELEYLKSALKYDAADYILKPIDIREISDVVDLVFERIRKEFGDRQHDELLARKLEESLPLLREKFALGFIEGNYSEFEYVSSRMEFLELPVLMKGRYVSVDIVLGEEKTSQTNKQSMEFGSLPVCHYIRTQGSTIPGLLVVGSHENEIILVLSFFPDTEPVECIRATIHFMETIQPRIESRFGRCSTAGIGNPTDSLMGIPKSYRQSVDAVNQRFVLGCGVIIPYSDILEFGELGFFLPKDREKTLQELILVADFQTMEMELDAWFDVLAARLGSVDGRVIQQFKLELIGFLLQTVKEVGIALDGQSSIELLQWDRVMKLDTMGAIRVWFITSVTKLSTLGAAQRRSRSLALVDKSRQIIRNEYRDPINLQIVAERLNVSSNYLSAVFKQELKIGFIEFLIEFRMMKAKELMKDPTLKIQTIGSMVGYGDQNYFARAFRKRFGVSPTEYREKIGIEDTI
jgi:two-component system response regulator YesN